MRVLFVSSGNSRFGISPFIRTQGESLQAKGLEVEFFLVEGKGIRGYLKNLGPLRRRLGSVDIVHAHYSYCGMVAALASRLLVLRNGKMVEEGAAADLFKNPKSDYTRALFAAAFNLETAPEGVVSQ